MTLHCEEQNVHQPVLMQKQYIEPVIFVMWHEHSDTIAPKFVVHSGVFDVTNAIQA